MAASILIHQRTGVTAGTDATAEGGILKWNRSDDNLTTSPLPIPVAAGTNFSYYKTLFLKCNSATGAGTTISNRKVNWSGTLPLGMALMYKNVAATYTQATAVANADIAGGTEPPGGTTAWTPPTGWTQLTNTAVVYTAAGAVTANGSVSGDLLQVALGVGSNYAGGGSTAAATPTLVYTYDEI